MTPSIALTIAGSDPSGGAGIQADLKTFHRHGVYGQSALTLITAQNTQGVTAVHRLPGELVRQQIAAALDDIGAQAIKTGALGSAELIAVVAEALDAHPGIPLVVDPVLVSKHGHALAGPDAVAALREHLMQRATVLTPNWHETAALSGRMVSTVEQAREGAQALLDAGARAVLVKGAGATANDLLLTADGAAVELPGIRIATRATHGTGCTFAAALTANLAKGLSLTEAALHAKAFVAHAIVTAPVIGRGTCTPVNHWA